MRAARRMAVEGGAAAAVCERPQQMRLAIEVAPSHAGGTPDVLLRDGDRWVLRTQDPSAYLCRRPDAQFGERLRRLAERGMQIDVHDGRRVVATLGAAAPRWQRWVSGPAPRRLRGWRALMVGLIR